MGGFSLNLDIGSLVNQIIFAESEPIRRVETKQEQVQQEIQVYEELISKLNSLEGQLSNLRDPEKFAAKTATSSNEDLLTASASSSALTGTHQIQVNRLALLDNFVSDATFTTSSETIGTGSFDLTVGTTATTITIDATNNTLSGLKSTINNSGAEVSANIVNDGSGFRLTLTSKDSGSENAISIANNTLTLADSSPFNFSRTHNIASVSELDAELLVNGLTVTSSSNKVEDVVEGTTLNLTGTSASTFNLTIANDTETVTKTIEDFVAAYNDAYDYINGQSLFIEGVGAGVLAGDALARNIQSDLSSIVRSAVPGLDGPVNNLGAVGVLITSDGTLEIQTSTLEEKLEENFTDIQKLFLAFGETSHSSVKFLGVGSNTEAGVYQVDISQVAEAATLTSPNAISVLLVNETLTFTSASVNSVISLTSGMTIDAIVSAVNTQFDTDSIALTASKDASDHLVITTDTKGASSSFTVVSDVNGVGTGFGTAGMSDSGVDLDGTLTDLSDSMVYQATATSGDTLKGDDGPVKDLTFQFLGSTTGTFGTIDLTLGYAELLNQKIQILTDSVDSPIEAAITGMEGQVEGYKDRIEQLEEQLIRREAFLIAEFSQADQALSELATLQSVIASQIRSIF